MASNPRNLQRRLGWLTVVVALALLAIVLKSVYYYTVTVPRHPPGAVTPFGDRYIEAVQHGDWKRAAQFAADSLSASATAEAWKGYLAQAGPIHSFEAVAVSVTTNPLTGSVATATYQVTAAHGSSTVYLNLRANVGNQSGWSVISVRFKNP